MTEKEIIYCEQNKQFFLGFWDEVDQRPGTDNVLRWLENETDFFTAPASTKYHGNNPGGLVAHSLNVCGALLDLLNVCGVRSEYRESAILVALLHDVCKCNYYKETTKRKQDAAGKWSDERVYYADDNLPMGHGEKSLFLLMRCGLELTDEEAAAIRWHMGAYADRGQTATLGRAFDRYPLALFLHLADMIAAHYMEVED